MKRHPHIVIICSRLDTPGGVEKAVIQLANLLVSKQYTVTLLVAEKSDEPFYPLSSVVDQLQLPLTFGIGLQKGFIGNKLQFLRDTYKLKEALKLLNARVIISTEYPYTVAMVLAANRKNTKLISWEHHHFYGLTKSRFWKSFIKYAYPKLKTIVCANDDETSLFNNAGYNAVTIPHFLTVPDEYNPGERTKEILTIGWLSLAKGTDRLLPVAKKILDNYPEWTWRLIGKGDMQQDVETFIETNNLQGRLIITSPVSADLSSNYQTASLLVHTSRLEAFGLVIAEAMSYGLPAIAFDCLTGPRHIIRNNEDGILVNDDDATKLYACIAALIEDEEQRKKMGNKAFENVKLFSPEMIYPLWENLIKL